jgi:tetratricopeptide (TPR) repeat protein
MAYGMLNQTEKAQDAFAQAIRLQPGYDEALNNLGYSYFLAGQTDKAIDTYKLAVQSNPKNTRTLFNLVTAYAKENQWELARQSCATLAELDPATAARLNRNFPSTIPAPLQPSHLQMVSPPP